MYVTNLKSDSILTINKSHGTGARIRAIWVILVVGLVVGVIEKKDESWAGKKAVTQCHRSIFLSTEHNRYAKFYENL